MARAKIKLAGDIGPDTPAQMYGANVVVATGENPNNIRQKRRENILERMHKNGTISIRQLQAGQEIQIAFCNCERLSSGSSDYARPIVDNTPVPDRFIDRQVNAHTKLKFAMASVPSIARADIESVCWRNENIPTAKDRRAAFKMALSCVADKFRF